MTDARRDRLCMAAAVLIPAAVYLHTMAPAVYFGDSGELNTAAFTLGLAHAPGYPLYVLLGKAATFLPLGGIAFRMNLLSVACAAAAIGLLFALLRRLTANRAAALTMSLAFAFSFTVWEQSLKSRAYPMNLLLGVLVLLLAVRWWQHRHDRDLLAAWLLFGLGLGNHEILLITAAPLCALMVAGRRDIRARVWVSSAFFFCFGLGVYLYLPIRSAADPWLDWGNPETLPRLLDVLLQRQYSHKMLNPDLGPKIEMARRIAASFWTELTPVPFLAGVLGVAVMATRARALLVGLAGMVLFNVLLRVNYIGDWEFFQIYRYLINSYLALAIAGAFGLAWALDRVKVRARNDAAYGAVALLAGALIVLGPLASHWNGNRLTRHWLARDYARSLLQIPEQGALLFVGGDNDIYPLWNLQALARYREDVVCLGKAGFYADWLVERWAAQTDPAYFDGADALPAYEGKNALFHRFFAGAVTGARVPVYSMYNDASDPEEADRWALLRDRFTFAPVGLPMAVSVPGGEALYRKPSAVPAFDTLPLDTLLDKALVRDAHTREVLGVYAGALTREGSLAMERGAPREATRLFALALIARPDDFHAAAGMARALATTGDLKRAAELLDDLTRREEADFAIWLNLGAVRQAMGDAEGARRAYERARQMAPDNPRPAEALRSLDEPVPGGGER